MNKLLVSVIVPMYNGAAYLGEALASVRGQVDGPVELIVVDDGSRDSSAEIAASYRPMRQLTQAHQGAAVARNLGLATASGDLVAFLDQDDWWEPDKLRRQVAYALEHPEVEVVLTRQRFFLHPGTGTPGWLTPELLDSDQPGQTPSALLARKTLFDRLGGFNPEYPLTSAADWFLRAQAAGVDLHELPDALTHRRVHAGNQARLAEVHNQEQLRLAQETRRRGAGASG